ncbi:MAG: formate hydrogenlyase maturation HycH family protein [Enterobacteriaceae bacterium]
MRGEEKVIFWSLRQKFLDKSIDVPEQNRQVLYYSLAIGHHVGVIDCLNTELICPLAQYQAWLELLPAGEARRKMQGVLTFGEITIDSTHTSLLGAALAPLCDKDASDRASPPWDEWSRTLMQLLQAIVSEPALYLIVKRQPVI